MTDPSIPTDWIRTSTIVKCGICKSIYTDDVYITSHQTSSMADVGQTCAKCRSKWLIYVSVHGGHSIIKDRTKPQIEIHVEFDATKSTTKYVAYSHYIPQPDGSTQFSFYLKPLYELTLEQILESNYPKD